MASRPTLYHKERAKPNQDGSDESTECQGNKSFDRSMLGKTLKEAFGTIQWCGPRDAKTWTCGQVGHSIWTICHSGRKDPGKHNNITFAIPFSSWVLTNGAESIDLTFLLVILLSKIIILLVLHDCQAIQR